jgi:hypothetical protein
MLSSCKMPSARSCRCPASPVLFMAAGVTSSSQQLHLKIRAGRQAARGRQCPTRPQAPSKHFGLTVQFLHQLCHAAHQHPSLTFGWLLHLKSSHAASVEQAACIFTAAMWVQHTPPAACHHQLRCAVAWRPALRLSHITPVSECRIWKQET